MPFDNLMGYILSMCMQNFITIFHSVQEFFTFQNFHCFIIWSSAKPRPMKNGISQSLELDLENINVYTEIYQNFPLISRDKAIFTFFQNLALGKASTDLKCHLTISWGTSCQYECVCKISSQYSTQFKR